MAPPEMYTRPPSSAAVMSWLPHGSRAGSTRHHGPAGAGGSVGQGWAWEMPSAVMETS